MHDINVNEMTFSEIVTAGRNHATNISSMLDRCDPKAAASVLLQLAEIEDELASAVYSDLLAIAMEYENTPVLLLET